jgi:hypothetical protein
VSDIDTAVVDSLKVLDPERPIREADMEYAMVDATIVKVHRHGQGAKGGPRAKPSAVPKAA